MDTVAKRNAFKILVVNTEGKTSVGRPRRRWQGVKMYVRMWIRFVWLRIGKSAFF
jgi:hypothetical protein